MAIISILQDGFGKLVATICRVYSIGLWNQTGRLRASDVSESGAEVGLSLRFPSGSGFVIRGKTTAHFRLRPVWHE